MLSKEICKKCHARYVRDANKPGWVWNYTDENRWNYRAIVFCPPSISPDYSTTNKSVPSNCPYHLEHVVSLKKELEHV